MEIPFHFVLDRYLSTDNNSWFYFGDFLFWFVLFCACFFFKDDLCFLSDANVREAVDTE